MDGYKMIFYLFSRQWLNQQPPQKANAGFLTCGGFMTCVQTGTTTVSNEFLANEESTLITFNEFVPNEIAPSLTTGPSFAISSARK